MSQVHTAAANKESAKLTHKQLIAARIGVAVASVILWELLVMFDIIPRSFLPKASTVGQTIWELTLDGELWSHILTTLQAAAIGLLLGTVVGVVVGLFLGLLPRTREIVEPFITMMNSMPRIALAPLFILWFGIGVTSRVVLVFSLVVFIVLTNTLAGTLSVNEEHLVMARLYRASRRQMITKITLPATIPWIVASIRLSIAWSLAGAVIGEMFLGQSGLGYLVVAGSGVFDLSQIFAALVIIVLIAWVADNLARSAEARLLKWRPSMG